LCVSLGLKKPGDFTVSEGHEHPLVSSEEQVANIVIDTLKYISQVKIFSVLTSNA
jgi:hypothetical protein